MSGGAGGKWEEGRKCKFLNGKIKKDLGKHCMYSSSRLWRALDTTKVGPFVPELYVSSLYLLSGIKQRSFRNPRFQSDSIKKLSKGMDIGSFCYVRFWVSVVLTLWAGVNSCSFRN